jgi:hypothetical protein
MMGLMTKMVLMKELLIKSGRTRKMKERMKVHIHQNPWLLNKVNA